MQKNKKWLSYLGISVVIVLSAFLVYKIKNVNNVSAADLSQFEAGNIISDAAMSDYTSMSESDIQNFLTSKNSCNNTNYSYYLQLSANKNYTWHWANGHFVCLSEERFGDGETIGSGDTAAHIIWQAAQDYKINPKVLIVLLQKETGLITDKIPNNGDYRKATGYGCPDTAACSSEYYGFKNQVRRAAELFRNVLDGGWSKYAAYKTTYIQYNPDGNCGGSNVYIKNKATAALYRYTPYQPNSAALSAGYGTGDSCSSYGNRNFYNYYTDWFGSTQAVSYNTIDVPDGIYEIQSSLDNNKVIDIDNDRSINGTNIQIWGSNNSDAQKWNFTKLNDGTYKITNAITGIALDLSNANVQDGSNIQAWEYNGTCAQRWKLLESGSNVIIASACSISSVIDLNGAHTGDGTNIQIYTSNGSKAQKWNLMPAEKVTDGLYYLKSNMNNNKVVDISGGTSSAKNGTNIHLWTLNETPAQYWSISRGSDGYYTVTNPNTGKVLDVNNAGITNGTNLQLWDYNGTCAQKWRILKNGNTYTFISACSYRVVDVSNAKTADGTNIQIYEANNSNAQKWQLSDAKVFSDMKNVTLVSAISDKKVLDVANARTTNGTNIHLWSSNGTNAQKWNILYNSSDNTYRIVSALGNNKVLDVNNAGTINGANIQLWSYNGTCAQKWHIIQNGDYYVFESACSGKSIDVAGAEMTDGTNIQLWSYNGSKAQMWKIKK